MPRPELLLGEQFGNRCGPALRPLGLGGGSAERVVDQIRDDMELGALHQLEGCGVIEVGVRRAQPDRHLLAVATGEFVQARSDGGRNP